MHKCILCNRKEASLLGPQGLTRGVCFRQERKAGDKRTVHTLKYLHLEVCIKKRISLYHPDWGLSIKAESTSFHLAQQSRGWGALAGGEGWQGYVSEPRRFPLAVLTQGGKGEMACSPEFAGLIYKKREWAVLRVGGPLQAEKRGPPHTPSYFSEK